MTNIVVADDHPIVRKGLVALLQSEAGCTVVGEAEDGLQAVALVTSIFGSRVLFGRVGA